MRLWRTFVDASRPRTGPRKRPVADQSQGVPLAMIPEARVEEATFVFPVEARRRDPVFVRGYFIE
jgi:hypothetical protein